MKNVLLGKSIVAISTEPIASLASDLSKSLRAYNAMKKSLISFGYCLDNISNDLIKTLSVYTIKNIYNEISETLNLKEQAEINSARVFYTDFPNNDISEEEVEYLATLHYITVAGKDVGILSEDDIFYPKRGRNIYLQYDKKHPLKILTLKFLYYKQDLNEIVKILQDYFKESFQNNKAINNVVINDLKSVYEFLNKQNAIPTVDNIPFHENIAKYFDVIGTDFISYIKAHDSIPFLKTITDYLRIYRFISTTNNTNIAMLSTSVSYKTIPRYARRWFLNNLNKLCAEKAGKYKSSEFDIALDEFDTHRQDWIYAFENLHPGEYYKRYKSVYAVAKTLRSKEYKTYNGLVEDCFKSGDTKKLIKLLSSKPGVFARKLDAMLRNPVLDTDIIIGGFEQIASKISLNVLIQLHNYYKYRNDGSNRVFTFNNDYGITSYGTNEALPKLSETTIMKITSIISEAIKSKASKLFYDLEGKKTKIFVNESLYNYPVPSNERTVSSNIRSIPSGSRKHINVDKDIIRLFSYWSNMTDEGEYPRVDIDLSCHFLDKDFNNIESVSWHNYSWRTWGNNILQFSGDVTDAPNGAAEYIDINYKKLHDVKPDFRYAVVVNNVYTGQCFGDIPKCTSGIMLRSKLGGKMSGDFYELGSVVDKYRLTQKSTMENIAFVIDLETSEVIYIDKPTTQGGAIAGTNFDHISYIVMKAVKHQFSMYEYLLECFSQSNNVELILNDAKPEDVDIYVSDSENATIHPWDQEKFVSTFMCNE